MNWPRSDGKIFINDGVENNLATISSSRNIIDDFIKYSKGYKESADYLIKHIINCGEISKLDSYFFPMTYLYRQSIELIMKTIYFKENTEKEKRESFLYDTKHNLISIWKKIFPYLEKEHESNKYLLEWIKKNLNNIVDFDKHSDVFRYPNTKDLDLFFKEEKRYNIRNLAENMNYIYTFFKGNVGNEDFIFKEEVVSRKPLIFVEGGSYYEFSHIGWNYDIEYHFYTYIKGYKESSDLLACHFLEDSRNNDIIVFPICFLYRNLLELMIKNILINLSSLEPFEVRRALNRKKHSLIGLWNLIKEDISKIPNDEDRTLKYAEKYLEEFQQVDVRSDKFRYPIDLNLKEHFDYPKKIDIKNLTLCLDELYNFFNGVTEALLQKNNLHKN